MLSTSFLEHFLRCGWSTTTRTYSSTHMEGEGPFPKTPYPPWGALSSYPGALLDLSHFGHQALFFFLPKLLRVLKTHTVITYNQNHPLHINVNVFFTLVLVAMEMLTSHYKYRSSQGLAPFLAVALNKQALEPRILDPSRYYVDHRKSMLARGSRWTTNGVRKGLVIMQPASLRDFHLVRTQFYMLSGPPPLPLFVCNKQWKCIGDLTPPNPHGCVRT